MTTKLQAKLDELIELAKEENNLPLAGILYAVAGAVIMKSEITLLEHIGEFSKQQMELINAVKAQRN